jgi:hypothetical protein
MRDATPSPQREPRPLAYDRDAVLTVAQVAAWLGRSERTIYRMGIKRTPEGFIVAQWVYDRLEERAA